MTINEKKIPKYDFTGNEKVFEIDKIENRNDVFVREPHRHFFYEIVWHTNSGDDHFIDFKPYSINKDKIFLIGPNRIHSMDTMNLTGYLIFFSDEFILDISDFSKNEFFNLFYTFDDLPYIEPTKNEIYELLLILNLIEGEYGKKIRDNRILQKYLQIFLLNIQRIKHKQQNKIHRKNHQYVSSILTLIEDNFTTSKRASFYANHSGLSLKRSNEILKEIFDKTITELVHERLIIEAKREIILGQNNIAGISRILGFDDPAYFSRFFKKQTGLSPEQFKCENSTT